MEIKGLYRQYDYINICILKKYEIVHDCTSNTQEAHLSSM
jgi:hypothetical protein